MDLADSFEHAEYRAEVRRKISAISSDAPHAYDGVPTLEEVRAHRCWQRKLAEHGLAGVTWPREHGGQGLGPIHRIIADEEIKTAGLPQVFDGVGLELLGPTILARGSQAQKDRYLRPMLLGDEVWCQLFSEPAAGSDLAGVHTRVSPDQATGWRVSGQKVWTTNAQYASFGLMLARTDATVPKHEGLTMFIVPMAAEGITIRGLRQISGEAHFNEVFFDDVHLDADAHVGPVNDGWRTALATLMYERLAVALASDLMGFDAGSFVRAIGERPDIADDPVVRRRLGEIGVELTAQRLSTYRQASAIVRGGVPGPEGALLKLTAVAAATAACELVVDALGPASLDDGEWCRQTSFLPGGRSAGGAEEILRNMIGERILGLPAEPRLDKHIPFAQLLARQTKVAR